MSGLNAVSNVSVPRLLTVTAAVPHGLRRVSLT